MAKILLVDDEKNVRASLAIALRREGYEVQSVAEVPEAIGAVREGGFDLVLTDLRLGSGSGLDVLRSVKAESPGTEVAVMTAYGSVENAVEAMQLGAFNYLQKPFEMPELMDLVERSLEHRETLGDVPKRRDPKDNSAFAGIVGDSSVIRELLEMVAIVAETDSTVLVTGETGTGKELVGRAIHKASRRANRIFCAVNSAAFPETLLESELFGHRRGAFTGAATNKKGLFEHAHEGTVFLDEVAEMPLSMQAKLLRFLQTGEIRPVGGEHTRIVDVRLVTATNKELEAEVAAGRFREDLYYRLAVIPVHVPALRDRVEDIPILANHFRKVMAKKTGKLMECIDDEAMDLLISHRWPGNVRELENTIERGVALCRGSRITVVDLPRRLREQPEPRRSTAMQSLQMMERRHILDTLDKVGWNRKRAAEVLQISTTTLWRRLKEFGIDPDGGRRRGPNDMGFRDQP